MLLDFIEGSANLWITPVTGGERTFEQYTGKTLTITKEQDLVDARSEIENSVPSEQLDFFQSLPYYHEDDYAIYVHAGLDRVKHPKDTAPQALLWMRDMEFYKNYRGKPCIFGHTPTPLLPLRGRVGRHGIYISHSAIGIDTGYNIQSPLSCLSPSRFGVFFFSLSPSPPNPPSCAEAGMAVANVNAQIAAIKNGLELNCFMEYPVTEFGRGRL